MLDAWKQQKTATSPAATLSLPLWMATTELVLSIGDWLFGLVVLATGVLFPVVLVWRKLFGGASGGKRSQ